MAPEETVRLGKGIYKGRAACIVRIVLEPIEGAYYVDWGRDARDRQFGVRFGPFGSIREAIDQAQRGTWGTVEWES